MLRCAMRLDLPREEVRKAVQEHTHPAEDWRYGTAGFRAQASKLPGIALRCGLIAALRALKTRAVVGLVVTASHNPECDNGVKLIDRDGAQAPAARPLQMSGIFRLACKLGPRSTSAAAACYTIAV